MKYKYSYCLCLVLLTTLLIGCVSASSNSVLNIQNLSNKKLPDLELDSLGGTTYNFPKDFENKCLIVFGFDHSQKDRMNLWFDKFVELYQQNQIKCFYKIPVIDNSNMAIRFMARNGMKMASKSELAKERTLTLFTDKNIFAKQLDLTDLNNPNSILFDKDGSILWQSNNINDISIIHQIVANE